MDNRSVAASVEEYIEALPPDTQSILREVRSVIRETAPETTERISYAIPTFDLSGRPLLYVAGWKNHISIYPVTPGMTSALDKELDPYQSGKGTLKFPLDRPIPTDLIRRIVDVRVQEVRQGKRQKSG